MTYCVGMCLRDGLVFASDSLSSAGVDYVTSYSKMHVFTPAPDRIFVLLSAGNLATTQELINRIRRDIAVNNDGENLLTANYMFEAAGYIGRISQAVQQEYGPALRQSGVSCEVSLILGGQIKGQPHSQMLIYPQGNYIETSTTTPYLQIGETKYGKPVLDRVGHYDMTLEDAARLCLVSLDSTAMSNITVGMPFELSSYRANQYQLNSHCCFERNGDYLSKLGESWTEGMKQVFQGLPRFEWEHPGGQPPVNTGCPTLQSSQSDAAEQQAQQQQLVQPYSTYIPDQQPDSK